MERVPTAEEQFRAKEHLSALLRTAKTYLSRPVILSPQPTGVPAGGMRRGVFLFGDVSGFTPLSEQLKKLGKDGAEQITAIINGLFTELVHILFDHGGDLLKFGGDALLGLFSAESDEEMATGALRAAQAALAMQRVMQQQKFAAISVMGSTHALKIKCGISAGPYFAAHIGTHPRLDEGRRGTMAYVTTGHTVNEAEEAEEHANPGEVVMTRQTYDLIQGKIEVGPVTKTPDENYCLVCSAPELAEAIPRSDLVEPPDGDVMSQITYLVDRLDRLTPYLSEELISRLVTDPGARIAPDHRLVAVMFANYKGISDLIADLGQTEPEVITQQLNSYFVQMAEVVERYEGTLARMDQYAVGDRLVIFFGAPRAHEDDSVRAVYTALEMQEAAQKFFSALRTTSGVYRFEQRIGINTGHLFAGNVGAPDFRQEYTLMGDDINMAARLMSRAGWQDIFISKRTRDDVAPFFDLEDKGELQVKGKQIRIATFKVLKRKETVGPTRGLAFGDSPLTGRDDSLEMLRQCGTLLLKGRGQIVSVVGNSGLGKSRLTREMKRWLLAQPGAEQLRWVEARALSFSEQMSYWMATQLLRSLLGVTLDANENDTLFILGQRTRELLGKDATMEVVPYLAYMMGLPLGEEWAWVKGLDPKVRQKQIFWAAGKLLMASAQQHPAVIVLDDLHWADEASLALVESLLEVTDQAPVMFHLIFRARRDKGCWKLRDQAAAVFPHRYTEVTLEPLSAELSRELLTRLLPGAEFRPETEQEILDKVAGNPFYLEEVVRSLIDTRAVEPDEPESSEVDLLVGQVKKKAGLALPAGPQRWRVTDKIEQIAVPDTLQAAIVARIDRLTGDARLALQMAAVIGRQFQMDLLRSVAEAKAEISLWLAQLERGGLVRPMAISDGSVVYAFPDALVQEVAYESLLVQNRRQIHRRVGETLEQALGDRVESECELLAYHFYRSDDPERAVKYLEMAAKRARDGYANETAIDYHSQLLEIRRNAGDLAGQAGALYAMGVMAYEIGDYDRARPWLQESVALWQQTGDTQNEGWSVMYLGMVDLKQANYTQAARHHERALQLARERQDRFQEGIHLTNLARVTMRLGQYDLARQQFQESLHMKQQTNDLVGQGFALFYQGLLSVYQGRHDQAETELQAAISVWQQVPKNDRVVSYYHYGMGLLALARQQFDQAETHLQQAHDISLRLVLKAETIENLSALALARLGLGKMDEAATLSHRAIKLLATQKDVEEVQQIYLNHYRVLTALKALEAGNYLQQAYNTMVSRANCILDEGARQTYLQGVKVNQEISQEWQRQKQGHGQ